MPIYVLINFVNTCKYRVGQKNWTYLIVDNLVTASGKMIKEQGIVRELVYSLTWMILLVLFYWCK